jgi:hypothetical protein
MYTIEKESVFSKENYFYLYHTIKIESGVPLVQEGYIPLPTYI